MSPTVESQLLTAPIATAIPPTIAPNTWGTAIAAGSVQL